MEGVRNESGYDLYSAITFLLVGLGIGSLLAIVFNPKQRVAPAPDRLHLDARLQRAAGVRARTGPHNQPFCAITVGYSRNFARNFFGPHHGYCSRNFITAAFHLAALRFGLCRGRLDLSLTPPIPCSQNRSHHL